MTYQSLSRWTTACLAALTVLAGCRGVSQTLPSEQTSASERTVAQNEHLTYISDHLNSVVIVFKTDGPQIGTISKGLDRPQGLFVDTNHNLWVANSNASNILEYRRGGTSPIRKLSDAGREPVGVTMCPNGTLYVSNFDSVSNPNSGSVSVYAPGATSTSRTLHYPRQGNNFFITCDTAGNVFTSLYFTICNPKCTGGVVEYPGGSQKKAVALRLHLGMPGGVKIDTQGNLLVGDQKAGTITEYTITGTATGKSMSTSGNDWVDFAAEQDGKAGTVVLGASPYPPQATSQTFPNGKRRHIYVSKLFKLPIGAAFDN